MQTERKPWGNFNTFLVFSYQREGRGGEMEAKSREKITSSGCFQVDNNIDQKLHDPTYLFLFLFFCI